MSVDLAITPHAYEKGGYTIHKLRTPGSEASFAMDLTRHLGVVSCSDDGEDSAGRQKLRLLTPEEVATRACQIAEIMFQKFEEKEWLLRIPDPSIAAKEDSAT